uniref:transporter suffix domain-containing protein n=1 Tax=Microbacterium sp. LWH7-1.2 TaxID=3135257 RepID=UPI0040535889
MWLFAAVVPFLPLDVETKAGVVAGDLAAAEVIFVLGVAFVGKEAYQAIKARLFKKKTGTPAAEKK